jgi:nitrite reductase/ring-hydroxylating ferredoxin subunit
MADALCLLEEIPDGTGRGFTLKSGALENPDDVDVLVVRTGNRAFGYVNSCPHARSPLDWTPERFMSRDGRHIQCATHGALFDIETGRCISGPCVGKYLTPVALTVTGDERVIAPD